MNPPIYPQIRHRAANSRNTSVLVFEILTNWVTLRCVERDPRFSTRAASYFRTPSPSGRLLIPSLKSPAIYCGKPLLQRAFAGNATSQRCVLNPPPSLSGSASEHQIEHKGIGRCNFGLVICWLPDVRRWPAAGIPSQSKGSWARAPGRLLPWSWTARRSRALLLVRRGTLSTVRQTPASATDTLNHCGFVASWVRADPSGDDAARRDVIQLLRSALKTDARGKADDTSFHTGAGRCDGLGNGHGRVRATGSRCLQPGALEHVGGHRRAAARLGRRAPVDPRRDLKPRQNRASCQVARPPFLRALFGASLTSHNTNTQRLRPRGPALLSALGDQHRVQ